MERLRNEGKALGIDLAWATEEGRCFSGAAIETAIKLRFLNAYRLTMLALQTILQKRYRIVRELGHGGMGTVYEAIDQRLTSKVALKEMLGARDGHARNAFEREAALLANLNHPNLPRVMDHFSEDDGAYLVMQFIEGMDLAEWLDLRGSPFPQAQVLQWAYTLLDVLEYLHGHNPPILHRDIKPSNIKRTEDGRIFLLDFGLAKGSLGQMPTYKGSQSIRGGTRYYSPLEQFSGPGTDGRSDLYALGATLYHLISGVLPADAGSRHQAIEDEEPDPLLPLADFASANVATVIERALSPSRKQRFGSATEMRRALRHAAEEDERRSLKEEYRRAEERRRQREEERQRTNEATARKAEEARQLAEAKTKKREEPEKQEAMFVQQPDLKRYPEQRTRQPREKNEDAHVRVEQTPEEKSRVDLPSTQPPLVPRTKAAEFSDNMKMPRGVVTTIPGVPPERLQTDQELASQTSATALKSSRLPAKSLSLMVAGVVALVILIGASFLISRRFSKGTSSSTASQSQKVETAQTNLTTKPESGIKAPEGMVYVPGGTFVMGRNKSDGGDDYESPAHDVNVKPFFIDIYEVTNEDYAKFVSATNRNPPSTWDGVYDANARRHPVTGVTWNDANDYALWAGKRLPTEEEWEFAARGTDGRRYPWGNEWRRGEANAAGASRGFADVGTYKGSSPFGVIDMVGNAWEWTTSPMRAYPGGRLPRNIPPGDLKVIRGGSYETGKNEAIVTFRSGWPAHGAETYDQTGFRCVKDAAQ